MSKERRPGENAGIWGRRPDDPELDKQLSAEKKQQFAEQQRKRELNLDELDERGPQQTKNPAGIFEQEQEPQRDPIIVSNEPEHPTVMLRADQLPFLEEAIEAKRAQIAEEEAIEAKRAQIAKMGQTNHKEARMMNLKDFANDKDPEVASFFSNLMKENEEKNSENSELSIEKMEKQMDSATTMDDLIRLANEAFENDLAFYSYGNLYPKTTFKNKMEPKILNLQSDLQEEFRPGIVKKITKIFGAGKEKARKLEAIRSALTAVTEGKKFDTDPVIQHDNENMTKKVTLGNILYSLTTSCNIRKNVARLLLAQIQKY